MRFTSIEAIAAIILTFTIRRNALADNYNSTRNDSSQKTNPSSGYLNQGTPRGFSYRIGNLLSNQFREEQRDPQGVITGSYGFKTPHGQFREVRYVADAGGFRAQVTSNEQGMSDQNPAHVDIKKLTSQSSEENQKPNHPNLVIGKYPNERNRYKSEISDQVLIREKRPLPSNIQEKFYVNHAEDKAQNESLVYTSSLHPPCKAHNHPNSLQDVNMKSPLALLHNALPTEIHPLSFDELLSREEVNKRFINEKESLRIPNRSKEDFESQRNKWVLAFLPFGIRVDHMNDVLKKFPDVQKNPSSDGFSNLPMVLHSKSISLLNPSNPINCKSCKPSALAKEADPSTQYISQRNPEHQLTDFASPMNPLKPVIDETMSKSDEDEIYLIQSIFAKRLASIINSSGIFPPHLLPLSVHKHNKEKIKPVVFFPQKINRTLPVTSNSWLTDHTSRDTYDNQPFYVKERNQVGTLGPHSGQLPAILQTLPKRELSSQLSEKIGVHRESDLDRHSLNKLSTGKYDKGKVQDLIVRNFYEGRMQSTHVRSSGPYNPLKDPDRYSSLDVLNEKTSSASNYNPSIPDSPSWNDNQHRHFSIPTLNRPLYDSKGLQIKPEDVPIHLHRFVPPKPFQQSNSDTSFRFSIPRPVPPRSLVLPPKPPAAIF